MTLLALLVDTNDFSLVINTDKQLATLMIGNGTDSFFELQRFCVRFDEIDIRFKFAVLAFTS